MLRREVLFNTTSAGSNLVRPQLLFVLCGKKGHEQFLPLILRLLQSLKQKEVANRMIPEL